MEESKMKNIIRIFYERFRYKKNQHKKRVVPKPEHIQIQKIYLRDTIFSNTTENTVKKMLVIHFCNSESESESREIIRLNVSYNDYFY
jgi:hypothetical protein